MVDNFLVNWWHYVFILFLGIMTQRFTVKFLSYNSGNEQEWSGNPGESAYQSLILQTHFSSTLLCYNDDCK